MLAFRCKFLFLLIGLVKADHIMQQAIKAFAEFHAVKCHILLFTYSNEFHDQRILLDFFKAVIKNNFLSTVLEDINNENRENSAVSTRTHCSKPLRSFIMGNISYVARYMITEKKREDIRKDVWLLFVENDFDQELIISEVKLSMRSEVYLARRNNDSYKFWEIYQPVKNNPIRRIYYGDWSADTGLKATQLTILERRRDFGGAVLRSARFQSVFKINIFTRQKVDSHSCWEQHNKIQDPNHIRLLLHVGLLLQKELNFTTEHVLVDMNNSDFEASENPQNVIIRMLARNEADVTMIGLLLDSTSLNIIDYSRPVAQTHYRVYIRKTDFQFDSGLHFLNPLSVGTWYNVVFIVALSPVMIRFMYYIGCKAGLIRTQFTFLDLCVTIHQMLCSQGGALQHEMCSISLVFVSFNLWAFLVRAMYSASLTSSLAIEQYVPPFNSLEELLEDGQYEFGVHQFSPARDLYYKTDNLFLKKLNKAVMEQNISKLPRTYLEGLQRVCSQKNYAFMVNRKKVMDLESQIPCKLHYLPYEVYTVSTAFAMSKHNEYLPFINRWLHVITQAGLLEKLQHEILGNKPFISNDSESFRSLTLKDTILLQVILIVGVALSVLILFAEIVNRRMKRNRRAKY